MPVPPWVWGGNSIWTRWGQRNRTCCGTARTQSTSSPFFIQEEWSASLAPSRVDSPNQAGDSVLSTLSTVRSGPMRTEVRTEPNPQVLGSVLCEGGPDPYSQVRGPSLSGPDLGVEPGSDLVRTSRTGEVTLADASRCHICHITQRRPQHGNNSCSCSCQRRRPQLHLQLPPPTMTRMTTTAAPAAATANKDDDDHSCTCSCHPRWERGWQQQLHLQLPPPTRTTTTTAAPAAATLDENDDNHSCTCSCHRQRGRRQ